MRLNEWMNDLRELFEICRVFLADFHDLKKCVMDGRTYGVRTDRPSYRDARTHLKKCGL